MVQAHLEHAIQRSPDFFTLNTITVLVSAIGADTMIGTESKESLWALIKAYLPPNIQAASSSSGFDARTLLTNELLPNLILHGMDQAVLAERGRWFPVSLARNLFASSPQPSPQQVVATVQMFLRDCGGIGPRSHNG